MAQAKKFRSLKTSLSLLVILGIAFIILCLTTYHTWILKEDYLKEEIEKAKAIAQSYAFKIKAEIEVPLDMARALGHVFTSFKSKENTLEFTREHANNILKNILKENKNFLGAWTAWEPNAFDSLDSKFANQPGHDKTGRFIPYWTRNKSQEICLEPLSEYETSGIGDYYLLPKKIKKEIVVDPYLYFVQSHGKEVLMSTASVPVIYNDIFYGVVGIDILCDSLQEILQKDQEYIGKTKISVLSHNGIYSAHSHSKELLGKNIKQLENFDITVIQEQKNIVNLSSEFIEVFCPIFFGASSKNWQIRLLLPMEIVYGKVYHEIAIQIAIGFSFLVIAAVILSFFLTRTVAPLIRLGKLAENIGESAGNILGMKGEIQKISASRKDEIGILAQAFGNMLENLMDIFQNSTNISANLEKASNNLLAMVTQQSTSAQEISTSVNQITTSLQEMNASAKQVENRAVHVSEYSHNCKGVSRDSLQIVDKNLKEMTQIKDQVTEIANRIINLAEESQKIDNITSTIKDIAGQTNMLSLNAAIEAARAGEYGKGFAVVANQIRELAQKSSHSSREIATIIKQIQSSIHSTVMVTEQGSRSVDQGVAMVKKTSEGFEKLISSVEQVEERAQEIRLGATQQSTATEQIALGMVSINDVLKQNVDATREAKTMVESLHEMSQQLMKSVEKLQFTNQ